MDDDIRIRTERLCLRCWRQGDAALFDKACNTPSVMRWLGGVQTRSQINSDVGYFIASEARRGITYWVMERLADAAFLGFCGLVRIPDRDCPIAGVLEIGWRLRESDWRRGYGFEAAHAVMMFAFDELGAGTVFSRTAAGNAASRKLMTKLGLKRRSELDYMPADGSDKLLVYSISARDWRAFIAAQK